MQAEALKITLAVTQGNVTLGDTVGVVEDEVQNWRHTKRCGGLRTSRSQG